MLNLVDYLRTHARKAADAGRHVDAELFVMAADEIESLRTVTHATKQEFEERAYD